MSRSEKRRTWTYPPATSTMSPGTMSLARILCTPLRSERITLPISGSYSFRASMALSALRSCGTAAGRWSPFAAPGVLPSRVKLLGPKIDLKVGSPPGQWETPETAYPLGSSHLPHSHDRVGHEDQHDDKGLHEGRRGLLTLLEPGQDLRGQSYQPDCVRGPLR